MRQQVTSPSSSVHGLDAAAPAGDATHNPHHAAKGSAESGSGDLGSGDSGSEDSGFGDPTHDAGAPHPASETGAPDISGAAGGRPNPEP